MNNPSLSKLRYDTIHRIIRRSPAISALGPSTTQNLTTERIAKFIKGSPFSHPEVTTSEMAGKLISQRMDVIKTFARLNGQNASLADKSSIVVRLD